MFLSYFIYVENLILKFLYVSFCLADRNVNTEGFKPNTQTHLVPLLATAIKVLFLCLLCSPSFFHLVFLKHLFAFHALFEIRTHLCETP